MDDNNWTQIEALYHSALELPVKERAEFVSNNSSDKTVEVEVLSLLAAAERGDGFLGEPAFELGLSVMTKGENLAGQTIGRYQIISLLGRGGMGEVYLAEDTRLHRKLALKLLPRTIVEDGAQVIRFEQEARAASSISHPNVAHIYEIAEADGRHFIAMEYVEGATVRELLKSGRVTLASAIDIGTQVTMALIAAHKVGVIHRDIKPENIVVTNEGFVKVLDFGLAKLVQTIRREDEPWVDLSSFHTQPELLMGTSHYMSPEQIRRHPIDSRTDLWSLGVVLHEMFLDCRPFEGDSFSDVIVSILEKEPGGKQRGIDSLPACLKSLLMKLLSKDPSDRYRSAEELLLVLQQCTTELRGNTVLTDIPVPGQPSTSEGGERNVRTQANARPNTIAERIDTEQKETSDPPISKSWTPNLRKLIWILPLVLIFGALVFGVRSWFRTNLQNAVYNVRFERISLAGAVTDIASSYDGKYIAYVTGERNGQTIHVMELATRSDLTVSQPATETFSGLAFSPDGTFIYYLENHGHLGSLYRVSKLGGGLRKVLENVNTAVGFSPDGSQLAFVRSNKDSSEPAELWKAKADGTEEKIFVKRSRADGTFFFVDTNGPGPVWSPDGKLLACAMHNGKVPLQRHIEFVDVANGTFRRFDKHAFADIGRVVWLSDNSGVLLTAQEKPNDPWQIYSLSQDDGTVRKVSSDANNYRLISGARDSSVFVTLNVESNDSLWSIGVASNVQTTSSQITAPQGMLEVRAAVQGKRIFTISNGQQDNLWIQDATGVAKQVTFEGNSCRPVVTKDGKYIVYSSDRGGKRNLWRINSDGLNPIRLTSGDYDDFPSLTPDDRSIVYRTRREVRKISIDGGESIRLFDKMGTYCALSTDGRLLAIFANEGGERPVWYIDIHDIANGQRVQRVATPSGIEPFREIAWIGNGLAYIRTLDGAANIWLQPNLAEPPQQLTIFKEGDISSFTLSTDGREIYCARSTKAFVPLLVRFFRRED